MGAKANTRPDKLDPAMGADEVTEDRLCWHNPQAEPFRTCGFPWFAQDRVYRRLPLNPSHPIRDGVDRLANHTAGGQIRFRTDSTRIAVRVGLTGTAGMCHMPATGQCGFDLYMDIGGNLRFVGSSKYRNLNDDHYEVRLLKRNEKDTTTFVLNFPLYQGVHKLEIGLVPGATLESAPGFSLPRPIVIYGTSCTQGGCATRPGMAYTNILSRMLDAECINLGFSGNGKGDTELAHLIGEIPDPALVILDYEGNAGPDGLRATLAPFIDILRAAHPNMPIGVLSRYPYVRESHDASTRAMREGNRRFQQELVAARRDSGDRNLHAIDGSTMLGEDYTECMVDGAHPTDLGFMRMASYLSPIISGILNPLHKQKDRPR